MQDFKKEPFGVRKARGAISRTAYNFEFGDVV
jgi:hypothetical protein